MYSDGNKKEQNSLCYITANIIYYISKYCNISVAPDAFFFLQMNGVSYIKYADFYIAQYFVILVRKPISALSGKKGNGISRIGLH